MRSRFLMAVMAAAVSLPASAAEFKWANNGDVRAMDPYTLNETVQNSLLATFMKAWFAAPSSCRLSRRWPPAGKS